MSQGSVTISRRIEIDMGHRVTNHGSKCRNVHGHRYVIEAEVAGPVIRNGRTEDDGMVMDYSVLKTAMVNAIDMNFDHALCLWVHDPLIEKLTGKKPEDMLCDGALFAVAIDDFVDFILLTPAHVGAVVVVADVPTAENLAKLWFNRVQLYLNDVVSSDAAPRLTSLTVYETPNSKAVYTGLPYPVI